MSGVAEQQGHFEFGDATFDPREIAGARAIRKREVKQKIQQKLVTFEDGEVVLVILTMKSGATFTIDQPASAKAFWAWWEGAK